MKRFAVPVLLTVVLALGACTPAQQAVTATVGGGATIAPEWKPRRLDVDGFPVRYDPCRPIPYVTHLAGGPTFARSELNWAIRQLEAASGLDLVHVGEAGRPWSATWFRQSQAAFIGFATESQLQLPVGASGWGDSLPLPLGDGRSTLGRGRVLLRPDHGWTAGADSRNPLGLMFLHELGHMVGLDHVDSPREIMTHRGNGTARALGAGDRQGLAAVGRPAGCL